MNSFSFLSSGNPQKHAFYSFHFFLRLIFCERISLSVFLHKESRRVHCILQKDLYRQLGAATCSSKNWIYSSLLSHHYNDWPSPLMFSYTVYSRNLCTVELSFHTVKQEFLHPSRGLMLKGVIFSLSWCATSLCEHRTRVSVFPVLWPFIRKV